MEKIKLNYQHNCSVPSDINEHLPTLLKYSNECKHITEMGVRWVCSTWALLMSNAEKIISYDIRKDESVNPLISAAEEYGINFQFIEADVLNLEIEKTDLLFIDTLHTYNQLNKELELHSENVSTYIILHDTESFGYNDEFIYEHASEFVKSASPSKQGLWNAVVDFLETEKGSNWVMFDRYRNNNGLTVLKRVN
jgi:hypothetical protein